MPLPPSKFPRGCACASTLIVFFAVLCARASAQAQTVSYASAFDDSRGAAILTSGELLFSRNANSEFASVYSLNLTLGANANASREFFINRSGTWATSAVCVASADTVWVGTRYGVIFRLTGTPGSFVASEPIGVHGSGAPNAAWGGTPASATDFGQVTACAVGAGPGAGDVLLSVQQATTEQFIYRLSGNTVHNIFNYTRLNAIKTVGGAWNIRALSWSVKLQQAALIVEGANSAACLAFLNVSSLQYTELACCSSCMGRSVAFDAEGAAYSVYTAGGTSSVTLTRISPQGVVNSTVYTLSRTVGFNIAALAFVNSSAMVVVDLQTPILFLRAAFPAEPQSVLPQGSPSCTQSTYQLDDNNPRDFPVSVLATAINATHITVELSVSDKPNVSSRALDITSAKHPRVLFGNYPLVGNLSQVTALSPAAFWGTNDYVNCRATITYTVDWRTICSPLGNLTACYANVSMLVPDLVTGDLFQATGKTAIFAAPYAMFTFSSTNQLYRLLCSVTSTVFECVVFPLTTVSAVALDPVPGAPGSMNWWVTSCAVLPALPAQFSCRHNATAPGLRFAGLALNTSAGVLKFSNTSLLIPPVPVLSSTPLASAISIVVQQSTFTLTQPVSLMLVSATNFSFEVVSGNVTTTSVIGGNMTNTTFTLTTADIVATVINATAQVIDIFAGRLLPGNPEKFVLPASLVVTLRIFSQTSAVSARHFRGMASVQLAQKPVVAVSRGMHAAATTPVAVVNSDPIVITAENDAVQKPGAGKVDNDFPLWGIVAVAVGGALVVGLAAVVTRVLLRRAQKQATASQEATRGAENNGKDAEAAEANKPRANPMNADAVHVFVEDVDNN